MSRNLHHQTCPDAQYLHRCRCLEPGKYAPHIEKWLNFYKSQQLILIDGEKFKVDPIPIMNDLQHTLDIQPVIDYAEKIVFDSRKGYFCEVMRSVGKRNSRQLLSNTFLLPLEAPKE